MKTLYADDVRFISLKKDSRYFLGLIEDLKEINLRNMKKNVNLKNIKIYTHNWISVAHLVNCSILG